MQLRRNSVPATILSDIFPRIGRGFSRAYLRARSAYHWAFPSRNFRLWISHGGTVVVVGVLSLLLIFSSSTLSAFASGVYTSSASDADGNNLLSSNTVNDTQTYDTSQDSSTTTQQQLGVDPNWSNGVTRQSGALRFDGSNDYVAMPSGTQTALSFPNTTFTASAWIKTTFTSPQVIMSDDGSSNGWAVDISSNKVLATMKNSSVGTNLSASCVTNLTNGAWHLVTVVYSTSTTVASSNSALIYVDGQLSTCSVIASTTTWASSSSAFAIGALGGNSSPYANGLIDDVRVYGRGITPDEAGILNRYGSISDVGLAAWWKLDDSTGTSALDSGPNGYTGTLMNGSGNSPAADGTANGPLWASGADAVQDGFHGCGPEDTGCVDPSNLPGAGNVSVTPDSSTTSTNSYDTRVVNAPGLSFDGSNDYVQTSNNASLEFPNATFSVSGWVKTTSSNAAVVSDGAQGGGTGGWWVFINASGKVTAGLKDSTGNDAGTFPGSAVVNDGLWHYMVVVITTSTTLVANDNAIIYIDGSLDTISGATRGSNPYNTVAGRYLGFGARDIGGSPTSFINASLSDMRVYGRALSTAEAAALYKGQSVSNLGLVGWWKMNDATGTSVADYSGSGYAGTLLNGSSNSPAADGTTNGPIWVEGPELSSAGGNGSTSASPSIALPGYAFRQPMQVNNGSGSILPPGYSVSTPTTLASVLNANQARGDTKDWRVAYQPTDPVRSLNFDGNTNVVNIPDSSSLRLTTAASIGVWYKPSTAYPSTTGSTKNNGLVSKAVDATGTGGVYSMDWFGTNATASLRITVGSGASNNSLTYTNAVFTPGKWYYIVGTWTNGSMVLYLNGVQVASGSSSISTLASTANLLRIGGNAFGVSAQYCAVGSIDDVRIYSRVISPSDVLALYNGGSGTTQQVGTGLVGWWRFDEGSGQVVMDSSGNNNSGYLGGTSASSTDDPTWNSTAGNGTPDGVVSTTYEIPRTIPQASPLTFDGSATKATITNPAADQVAMPQGTMSAWVYRTTSDATLRTVYDLASTGSTGAILFGDYNTTQCALNDKVVFQYGSGGVSKFLCGPVISNSAWHLLTVTWNSAGAKMYVDGSFSTSNAAAPGITVPTTSYLGSNNGTQRYFAGSIGETRLYNQALTAAQIAAMYAGASTTLLAPQKNLIEGWRVDEGTGTTLNDASGVGANATVTMGSGSWYLNAGPTLSSQTTNFQTVAPIASSGSSSDYYLYYGNPTETSSAVTTPVTTLTGLQFDGTNDTVTNASPASALNISGDITISAWVKPNGASEQGYIVGRNSTGGGTSGYIMSWNGSTGKINFIGGSGSSSATSAVFTDNGVWVLVTEVSSGGTLTYYRNGVSAGTSSNAAASSTDTLTIANRSGSGLGANTAFAGSIDDVRIYNRALSSTEVGDLYNYANTPPVSSVGLVGWWKMDDFSGTTTADSSGNGDTGTLSNFNFNNASGWQANSNLFQAASITTANVGAATVNAPRYFQWRADTGPLAFGTWSTELPIQAGPTALATTGVKLIWNMNGNYTRYDTFHIASSAVAAFSATKGNKHEFPTKVNIIIDGTAGGTTGSVDIIDASTNLLWMRIAAGSGTQLGTVPTRVAALNGHIYLANGAKITDIDLADDVFRQYAPAGNSLGTTTIANQASSSTYGTATGATFTASSGTGVAAAVIGTTPPKQDVALSTNSGIDTVFNATSGANQAATSADTPIYNFIRTTSDVYGPVALTSGGSLYGGDATSGGLDRWDGLASTAASVTGSTNTTATYRVIGTTTSSNSASPLRSDTVNTISVSPGQSSSDYVSNAVAVGTTAGVDLINENATLANATVNHYTATGNTGSSNWNSKGFGGALELNGTAAFAKIASPAASLNLTAQMTVEAWIYTTSLASTATILRMGTGSDERYGLRVLSNGGLDFQQNDGTTFRTALSNTGLISTNTWYHVAATRQADGVTINFYVNGIAAGSGVLAGAPTSSGTPIFCLGSSNCSGALFPGFIDEVRLSSNVRYSSNFTPPSAAFISDANTAGLWHFNEPNGQFLADDSGNGNTATLGATSSVGTDDPNLVSPSLSAVSNSVTNVTATGFTPTTDKGEGLTFNGTTAYVNVPDASSLHVSTAVTMSGWFNPATSFPSPDGTSHFQNIMSRAIAGTASQQVYTLDWTGTNATSIFRFLVGDGTNQVATSYTVGALTPGTWYFLTATWTPTSQALYVNGSLKASGTSTTISSIQAAGGTALRLGGYDFGSTPVQFLAGTLDDIRLYNAALSPNSVVALYNGGRGWVGGRDVNLAGEWEFNEGTGTTTADASGNGNTGTLTSGPTWATTTPVRSQPSFWVGTHLSGTGNDGAVTDVSLTSNRQLKSYTNSNSLMPGSDITSLSVGSAGLALVGTAEGAWNPGENGIIEDDPIALSTETNSIRFNSGTIRLNSGTIRAVGH